METGVLERIRALEADIERSVNSMVRQDFALSEIKNDRHRLLVQHFYVQQAEKIKAIADKLLDAYLDDDDIEMARSTPAEGADVVASAVRIFEGKVADLREYHTTYRDLPAMRSELIPLDPNLLDTIFNPREHDGACLDLESHYQHYSNFIIATNALAENCSTGVTEGVLSRQISSGNGVWPKRLDYYRFIPSLPSLLTVDLDSYQKLCGFQLYRKFAKDLYDYLVSFYKRTHPLHHAEELERIAVDTENEAEVFWSALLDAKHIIEKDPAQAHGAEAEASHDGEEDEEKEDNEEDAEVQEALGGVRTRNKVACGLVVPPPLRKYLKRFSLWPITYIESELLPTVVASTASSSDQTIEHAPHSMEEVKEVCFLEAKSVALLESLLFDGLKQAERVFLRDSSRTADELEADRARAEKEFETSLEESKRLYQSSVEGAVARVAQYQVRRLDDDRAGPSGAFKRRREVKEVPVEDPATELLGDDDQPIAPWLIRLQQLDKTFVCDVCGGTVYRGPKVFREHFGHERHAEGLRRLNVTHHLKQYEGVTSIRAVLEIHARLEKEEVASQHSLRHRLREELDKEEMQDQQGKVIAKQDYKRLQTKKRRT